MHIRARSDAGRPAQARQAPQRSSVAQTRVRGSAPGPRRRSEKARRYGLTQEARSALLEQMAPVVAHEVSQPLTAIAAYAGACARLLRAGDPESLAKALAAVESIAAEAQRGSEIVRRMRSVLTERDIGRERVEVEGLFTWIERKAAAEAAAAGTVFVREAVPAIAVSADGVLVRQVLLNLVYNALDAIRSAHRGAGVVSMAARSRTDGFAELAVSDDGSGVPPSVGEHMFDLAVSSKAQGGGIGLALCRSIVEAHGGRLWAEPNAALGTTFKLTLPVAT